MVFRRRRQRRFRFASRAKLPAELRPALARDERVVAWGRTGAGANRGAEAEATDSAFGGAAVVATNLGLFLPGAPERLGWHEIHKATWTGHALEVTPAELVEQREGYVVVADRPPITVEVAEPGDLPPMVRARVTRSVSFSSHHPVPGGGALVVARRVPGQDGVSWTVRYDEGTDPAGEGVREATDQLIAAHAAAQATSPDSTTPR